MVGLCDYSGPANFGNQTRTLFIPYTEKKTLKKDNTSYLRYKPPVENSKKANLARRHYTLIQNIKEVVSWRHKYKTM